MMQNADMTADWVSPIATSIVGIAGITATWLSGHRQASVQSATNETVRRDQREREHREERKSAYGQLLGVLSRIQMLAPEPGVEGKRAMLASLRQAASESLALVLLVGNPEVARVASVAVRTTLENASVIEEKDLKGFDDEAIAWTERLIIQMADDLAELAATPSHGELSNRLVVELNQVLKDPS